MNQKTDSSTPFTAQTTMLEALTADPSLGMVLMRDFHLGGCRNCGFNPHDTVEEVATQNGIPTERLLAALNRAR
ncbi:MAG: disulfide oxidoreductase [Planctomycetes bacterium]|nr:disulfide oxidoreductase [Planctomycetota bacterium]